jgi:hypothetical protein
VPQVGAAETLQPGTNIRLMQASSKTAVRARAQPTRWAAPTRELMTRRKSSRTLSITTDSALKITETAFWAILVSVTPDYTGQTVREAEARNKAPKVLA